MAYFEAMNINGYPYKRDVCGEWVPDEDARKEQIEQEKEDQQRKNELIAACRTRPCTQEELQEIGRHGSFIFLRYHGGMSGNFKQAELDAKFQNMMMVQLALQASATRKADEEK